MSQNPNKKNSSRKELEDRLAREISKNKTKAEKIARLEQGIFRWRRLPTHFQTAFI